MSNLHETYAAYCGCQIDLPWMKEKPVDLPKGKYITLHSWCEKETNRRYAHWQTVVDMLQHIVPNITICQIGDKKDQILQGVENYCGKTDMQQLNFLIRNSELHLGYDSFPMHIASMHDKYLVCMFRNYIEQSYPAWSSKEKAILLMPDLNHSRPPYGVQEPEPAVNKIPPETIVSHVSKFLGINT